MLNTLPIICYFISITLFTLSIIIININLTYIISWEIYNLFSSSITFDIIIEWNSIIYSSIIMFISGNVLKFSKHYIYYDYNYNRFTYILLLFILSINILVFIPNILCLLIGWDGLGITSFILIIYYNNPRSLGAGILTILINRLGDTFLLMAIISTLRTRNWLPINQIINNRLTIQFLGITLAALTKSAQLPYSRWLPAAIAAPTPVSALVHSSTLVTAGIFLLYRFNIIIYTSIYIQLILSITGILTILIARLRAIIENDIKKIIALSTLSHLGLITLCLGLTIFKLAILHIICHAIFKALLFITAGCLISINNHNQDLRLYNQFSYTSPITSYSSIISCITIIGIPFITGYYSKHAIIGWSISPNINIIIYLLIIVSIFFTSFYSYRFMILTIITPSIQNPIYYYRSSKNNNYPILFISLIRITIASILQWLIPIIPIRQPINYNIQFTVINYISIIAIIILLFIIKNKNKYKIYKCLKNIFFLSLRFSTQLLTELLPIKSLNISLKLYKHLDQRWLEKTISLGLPHHLNNSSSYINLIPDKYAQKNLLAIIIIRITTLSIYYKIII